MSVTKAIITAAGIGTRMLPETKAIPKVMIPILNKPAIQYAIEEAAAVGVKEVVVVIDESQEAIKEHFKNDQGFYEQIKKAGKESYLKDLYELIEKLSIKFIVQEGPYGNATPVKCAQHEIGNNPFFILWGDEFSQGEIPRLTQVQKVYEKYNTSVLSTIVTNDPQDGARYGFVQGEEIEPNVWRVDRVIEKPGVGKAPSNIAVISGHILTPSIFPVLNMQPPGTGGEYYLHEAVDIFAQQERVHACVLQNVTFYDSGNLLPYIKTIISMALQHADLKEDVMAFIKEKAR